MLYRAVKAKLGSDGTDYSDNKELIWGSFSSCSANGSVMGDFLEEGGYKTVFTITAKHAKSISHYSEHDSEAEFVLSVGSHLRVNGTPLKLPGTKRYRHVNLQEL